jgi:hypothetical protein
VGHTSTPSLLAFSSDSKRLASSDLGRILLWDLETGTSQELFGTPEGGDFGVPRAGRFPTLPEIWNAYGLAFTDDDKTLLAFLGRMPPPLMAQRKIASWSVPDGRRGRDIVLTPAFGMPMATQLAVSPNGNTIAVGGIGAGTLRLVNRRLRRSANLVPPGTSPQMLGSAVCAFSSDGKQLAVSRTNYGWIEIWDMARRRLKQKIEYASAEVMRFSKDDQRLVTVCGDVIRQYDVATGEPLQAPEDDQSEGLRWPSRAALSCDATLVAVVDPDCKGVRLVDVASGKPRGSLDHERSVVMLAFSPDGQTLALTTTARTVIPFGSLPPEDAVPHGEPEKDGDSHRPPDDPPGDTAPETDAEDSGDSLDGSGQGGFGAGPGGGVFGPSGGTVLGGPVDPEDAAIELWDVAGILQPPPP